MRRSSPAAATAASTWSGSVTSQATKRRAELLRQRLALLGVEVGDRDLRARPRAAAARSPRRAPTRRRPRGRWLPRSAWRRNLHAVAQVEIPVGGRDRPQRERQRRRQRPGRDDRGRVLVAASPPATSVRNSSSSRPVGEQRAVERRAALAQQPLDAAARAGRRARRASASIGTHLDLRGDRRRLALRARVDEHRLPRRGEQPRLPRQVERARDEHRRARQRRRSPRRARCPGRRSARRRAGAARAASAGPAARRARARCPPTVARPSSEETMIALTHGRSARRAPAAPTSSSAVTAARSGQMRSRLKAPAKLAAR